MPQSTSSNKPILIESGTRISWNHEEAVIYLASEQVFLIRFSDGRFHHMPPRAFYEAYTSGQIRLLSKPDAPIIYQPIASDDQAQQLVRLNTYLERLDREPYPRSKKRGNGLSKLLVKSCQRLLIRELSP